MGHIDRNVSETAVDQEQQVDVSKEFDGARHFSWGRWLHYTNPGSNGTQGLSSFTFRHRDVLHRITWRPKDTLRYLSPTYGKPHHLVVQATREVLQDKTGEWRRREVAGNAPWLLRLSSWALKELLAHERGALAPAEIAMIAGKVLVAIPLQMFLLLVPMGGAASWTQPYYKTLPAQCFDYPLHARNILDARPSATAPLGNFDQRLMASKEHTRLLKPRQLVIWGDQGWRVSKNTADTPYVFVSYTRRHWDPVDPDSCAPLHKLARHIARTAGLRAYWLDHQCIDQEFDMSEDIHTICDVVRGANQVCVAVPNLDLDCIAIWGSRMWTLPEVLICQNSMTRFYALDQTCMERSRISLAEGIWGNDQAGRVLAEHFSGTLTLSRLELIQVALRALSTRDTTTLYSQGDLAYALMGMLNRRPKADTKDNQFQALARLSLANDSDCIVERMVCMLPPPHLGTDGFNRKFVLEDELNANLWDIEPLCQVAGVCEGASIMLDGCRGASIRWKDIPAISYVKRSSLKRTFISASLRSGALWFLMGIVFCLVPAYLALGAIFLIIGLALIISSPWSIMMLYGGKVWGVTPWLIGIEGVMPIDKIEKFTFGNAIGRLRWAPSSSLLSWKSRDERLGAEPSWIRGEGPRPNLPQGHRLFTLIDTGTLTCHVFTAERPPSAAVIAGREGGMLRVVLCSYERSSGTMIKETILRMETPMLDKAGKLFEHDAAVVTDPLLALLGWIKLA